MIGGTLLFDRFGAVCREFGLSPTQTSLYFGALPYGSQRAAWDDLAAHVVATRGTA